MGHWEGSYQGGRESCQEKFPRGAVTGHRRGLLFLDRDIRSLSKGFDSEHVSWSRRRINIQMFVKIVLETIPNTSNELS